MGIEMIVLFMVVIAATTAGTMLGVSIVLSKMEKNESYVVKSEVEEVNQVDDEDMLVQLSAIMEYQPRKKRSVRDGR